MSKTVMNKMNGTEHLGDSSVYFHQTSMLVYVMTPLLGGTRKFKSASMPGFRVKHAGAESGV